MATALKNLGDGYYTFTTGGVRWVAAKESNLAKVGTYQAWTATADSGETESFRTLGQVRKFAQSKA
jgi:hypothetical protein